MPQQAWNKKRERQYEHIKEGLEDREAKANKVDGRSKMTKAELEKAVDRG